MNTNQTTAIAAFACGFFTCATLYFIAMPVFGGWCISYFTELVLGLLSVCGVVISGAMLLPRQRKKVVGL